MGRQEEEKGSGGKKENGSGGKKKKSVGRQERKNKGGSPFGPMKCRRGRQERNEKSRGEKKLKEQR